MKNYSTDIVSRAQVEEAAADAFHNARMHADRAASAVDAKQTEQIKKLRIWLAASFAANFLLAIGAYFA